MDISKPQSTIKCWVDLYSEKMYTWAFYKTSNKEIAEDLVQDTFLGAFKAINKFEGKSEPKTWLFSILNNKIAEHYRKQFRNPTITESQSEANTGNSLVDTFFDANDRWEKSHQPKDWQEEQGNLLDNPEFKTNLQACLGKLPPKWMAAIQLKYLEEKKGKIICQELGINPTNFWQILHRAKLQLRECLELNWFNK